MPEAEREPLLSVRELEVVFSLRGDRLNAIRRVNLDLYDGETLAIVGESGSGKSVLTKCFVGMLDKNGAVTGGSIWYGGQDLAAFRTEKEWLRIRGKEIAMVMQDPMTALNPLRTVGAQIQESVVLHQGLRGEAARREAVRLLALVGIPDPEKRARQYPHELSGGMRQRVVIASAVACRPRILICDEPTTALDVTVQAQILELIRSLQKQLHMTIIYITHDLGVVANVADRVAVMYAGQIIEEGTTEEIFFAPEHPYLWALLGALPQLGVKGRKLPSIDGTPPNLYTELRGDAFAPRNRHALKIDFLEEPPMFSVSPTHAAKTWLLDPHAPNVEKPRGIERVRDLDGRMEAARGTAPPLAPGAPLVEIRDAEVSFGKGRNRFTAVRDVRLTIYEGETLSLVGESGSGKTTLGRAVLRINPLSRGEITYRGERISGRISRETDRRLIKNCQMIFQDPMASLNERAKVDYIVSEGLRSFHLYQNEAERTEKVAKALMEVGLPPEYAARFPHEFSGGQRQRIGIARALIMEPEFVIADEPISALDVSIRAQILNLLNDLKRKKHLTYLFIAHDLSVVRFISDRIAVISGGRIVELAEAEELFRCPLHPYTKALLSAVPIPDPQREREKRLVTYDPAAHGYGPGNEPRWCEAGPGHFVLGSERELNAYREALAVMTG